jgi:hypothetical protein
VERVGRPALIAKHLPPHGASLRFASLRFPSARVGLLRVQRRKKFSEKIQAIYKGKCTPITMQGFARAAENPPPQEQGKNNGKTTRRTI